MTTSAEGKMMSSSPLESGFNTRNQPVILDHSELTAPALPTMDGVFAWIEYQLETIVAVRLPERLWTCRQNPVSSPSRVNRLLLAFSGESSHPQAKRVRKEVERQFGSRAHLRPDGQS
jgi:hypothetical protein